MIQRTTLILALTFVSLGNSFAASNDNEKCAKMLVGEFSWPENREMIPAGDFVRFIKPQFEALNLKPIKARKKIAWPGPVSHQRKLFEESYESSLSRYRLNYDAEHGRDPLDSFLFMAFRMGMEQGRRIAFHNQVLPALMHFGDALRKIQLQESRQRIALDLVAIVSLMNVKLIDDFQSYPMVRMENGQLDWPTLAHPADYKELAGLLKNVLFQFYRVDDSPQLDELIIAVLKAGAEQVSRLDSEETSARSAIVRKADRAFLLIMNEKVDYKTASEVLFQNHFQSIRELIFNTLFREVDVSTTDSLIY